VLPCSGGLIPGGGHRAFECGIPRWIRSLLVRAACQQPFVPRGHQTRKEVARRPHSYPVVQSGCAVRAPSSNGKMHTGSSYQERRRDAVRRPMWERVEGAKREMVFDRPESRRPTTPPSRPNILRRASRDGHSARSSLVQKTNGQGVQPRSDGIPV
jgi:hypothetical protein